MVRPDLIFKSDYAQSGANIHRLDTVIGKRLNESLAELDITFNQAVVLAYILISGETPVTQRHLEDFFSLTNPSISAIIQVMVRKNLIYREKNAADKRSHFLRLTEKGKALAEPGMEKVREVNREIYSALTDDEFTEFFRLIIKLNSSL